MTTDAMSLEGKSLGKYQIKTRLGAGNTAVVYLALDPFVDREVAIKVACPAATEDAEQYRRLFFNEAQTAGLLRHPNITAIYDAGVQDDIHYIVMEYVHGGATLDQFAAPDNLLGLEEVTKLFYQCAQALDYAHRRGVIHRDIKPKNILLTPNHEIKISDFGAAVTYQQSPALDDDVILGSPLYMSPEQIQHQPLTSQSDLFSLGVTFYEMLTGKHPFTASNLDAIRHQILTKKPLPLQELRPEIPELYERVIEKALAKSAYYRYKNGADIAGDLSLVFDVLRQKPDQISLQQKFAQVRALRFFQEFPDSELWEIINAAEWLEFDTDYDILHEGEFDPSFYVVVRGAVDVIKGARRIVPLQAGDCFGEMAVLTGRRRTATIRAHGEVCVLKLKNSIIERATINCQLRFQRNFSLALIERLELATNVLTRDEHSLESQRTAPDA